jgi:glycosyltransferase involved in cell wall biosynthesis
MRVAFIDQRGNVPGGAEFSLALLLRHLPPHVEPHVIFFSGGHFERETRAAGFATSVVEVGRYSALSTRERLRFGAIGEAPASVYELAHRLRALEIDVVHTNSPKAHVLGTLAARVAGKPCVAHLRDVLHGTPHALVRTSVALATRRRIAISSAVADAHALGNTSVIENPLELADSSHAPDRSEARHELGIDDDVPVASIIGRIDRGKGHDRFLRALASVVRSTPMRGLIVGAPVPRDADVLPELRSLRQSLGLDGVVRFVDRVTDPRRIYAATDIHVNASIAEPFGRTVIEAAAARVPTVCFEGSGVAESMRGRTGIVVPAADESALASGMLRYGRDAHARREAGDAAFAWSRRFDAAQHARRVVDVLERAYRERDERLR